jgi:small subunit ribosomal protein S6
MPNDRQYEFVYVLAPTVANSEVEAIQGELDEQIRKLGGSVENTDLWGRRKLAYPIGNFTEGIYVVQLLRGPGEMVTELERRLRVKDDVLRYLTVRVDEDLRKVRRAAEKRKADAERRRARRPQEEPAPQPATEPADEAAPAEGEPSPPEAAPSASDEAVDEPPSAPPAAESDEAAGS